MMKIGKKLKQLRKAKGLTIKQLADACHFSSSFISDVEHEKKNPSIENIKYLADILNAPYTYFLEDDNTSVYATCIAKGTLEVLDLINDFDEWNENDKEELLHYLRAKRVIRQAKVK